MITGIILFFMIYATGLVTLHGIEFACMLFGSLLPDVDHQHSMLGRFNLVNRSRFCKHRGHCHSFIGALLLSAPFALFVGVEGALFIFGGALGHLAADKLYSFGKRRDPFAIRVW